MAVPTLVCFQGGLRPGDEVEFWVRDSDTGGEVVIRRRAAGGGRPGGYLAGAH
ncbi:MAG: hypothetical protein ACYC9Q_04330 [Bacillota bacterium]